MKGIIKLPVHTDNALYLDQIQAGFFANECMTLSCAHPHQVRLHPKE